MAGLISGPRPPATSQVVFVPQTSSSTTSTAGATSTATTQATSQESAQATTQATSQESAQATTQALSQSAEESRIASLLSSQRGRVGTIRTGFLGVTDDNNAAPQRKTLLGE